MKLTYKHTKYACYCAYISTAITNNLASLLFFTFQTHFGITNTQLAALITLNFGTQLVVDLLGARFADKIGYRPLLIVACSSCIVGLLSMSLLTLYLPGHYAGLCIASFIYAIGGGLGEVLISPLIEALPGDEKASAMSMLHSFYCWGVVGVVALSAVFFALVGTERWYILPILWAVAPLFTLILFCLVPIRTLNDDAPSLSIKKLFSIKLFWLMALLMLCAGAAELAVSQWSSMFAEAALGVSKTVGDLLGPCLFGICMGISRLVYGRLGNKLPLLASLCLSAIVCFGGYAMIFFVSDPYVSLCGCGLVGIGVGLFWPGILSLSSQKLPSGGTAMFAMLAMFGDLGCALGPQLTAIVSEVTGLREGLFAASVFPIIIAISTALMLLKKKFKADNSSV